MKIILEDAHQALITAQHQKSVLPNSKLPPSVYLKQLPFQSHLTREVNRPVDTEVNLASAGHVRGRSYLTRT